MTIKVLDNNTINRIAAGEVVERPASVVKELVENALDAGATQIAVEIKGGGIALIRVADNGSGIPGREVELAFERHATSKITGAGDLHNIATLGFRGEALPSIAAVADIEILTATGGEKTGNYLRLENGVVVQKRGQARTPGTTITVHDLFKRVPARLKFMKSVTTETSRIANVVSQYALAYPGVAFSLTSDGRQNLRTAGKGKLIEAIAEVYGAATAAKMLPVVDREEIWRAGDEAVEINVTGMVGQPDLARAGRDLLSFFVNRRWVNSRTLAYAVEEAYSGLLMTGRHPVAVLEISVPPGAVDVNIHPAKSEVKFRNDGDVFRAVQRAVRRSLVDRMPVPKIEEIAAPFRAASSFLPQFRERPEARPRPTVSPPESQSLLLDSLPVLRVAGQVMDRYIVAEGPDGLYLIDQHAAHERVRYDAVKRQRRERKPEVQGLLEPATFEVIPRQDAVLRSCLDDLKEFGFVVESFGERTYLVRAVPALVADEWPEVLREMLDDLVGEERSRWEDKMVASIACHGAIRSGQTLSDDEMRALVRQLEASESPQTCPHGRPTVIRLSAAQLEREFGRG
jgi:DNA mismatch repair protein MutL